MFSHLTRERITDIKNVFAAANLQYDRQLRALLLDGIDFQFVGQLRDFDNPDFQLSGDLNRLNSIERLADSTIPFEIWLKNAVRELSYIDRAKVLSHALDELTNHMSSAAPISEPANVPNLVEVREKIIQRDDMVAYGFLAAGFEAGKSVARLKVTRHDNGALTKNDSGEAEIHQGTGWLLTADLLMTNHHVVNARIDGQGDAALADLELQANNTTAQFDYDAKSMAGNSVKATRLEAFDTKLDYAVLRLESSVGRAPLVVDPERMAVTKESYKAVNIIQHPSGGPKRVALRNNLVYDSEFPRLRYFTDTEHGSSGSPVFNDQWQVVALHRASTFVNKGRDGVTGWVNEGTQMGAILDDLKLKNENVYRQVTGAGSNS
jgi:V8-like Glu-specific endopeptidase